jgi:hypothetical protein
VVTFENTHCLNCGTALGFDWSARTFVAGGGCANRSLIGCNDVAFDGRLCVVCALTRTRPPDATLAQFAVAETAKTGQPAADQDPRAIAAQDAATRKAARKGDVLLIELIGRHTQDSRDVDPVRSAVRGRRARAPERRAHAALGLLF